MQTQPSGASSLPDRYWHDDQLDWDHLADDVASKSDVNATLFTGGGRDVACSALALLLGSPFWTAAAHHCIMAGSLHEPTLSILRMVRPAAATNECLRILRAGQPDERLSALHLLADLAETSHLDLIPDLLNDHDPRIQAWAGVLLRNILFTGEVDPQTTDSLVRAMEDHPNEGVRATAENIREIQAGSD